MLEKYLAIQLRFKICISTKLQCLAMKQNETRERGYRRRSFKEMSSLRCHSQESQDRFSTHRQYPCPSQCVPNLQPADPNIGSAGGFDFKSSFAVYRASNHWDSESRFQKLLGVLSNLVIGYHTTRIEGRQKRQFFSWANTRTISGDVNYRDIFAASATPD